MSSFEMPTLTLMDAERTVEALHTMGSIRGGADALGLKKSAVHERVARLRLIASRLTAYEARVAAPPELVVDNTPAPANDEPAAAKPEPYRMGGSPADREVTKLRDEVRRLRQGLEDCHRDQLNEDEVRRMLGVLSEAPHAAPSWVGRRPHEDTCRAPQTLMTMWSDWHLGETVSLEQTAGVNEYSVPIARQRFRRVVEKTISIAREHGPGAIDTPFSGAVVCLVGDMVSGGLHPELMKTDETTILQSILIARDMLVEGLTAMADAFGSVYAPAVCGNHGRMTHKPEYKGYAYQNADWLIYQLARGYFDARGDTRVHIDVRVSNDVYFKVHDTRFLLTHGDMMGVRGGDGIIGSIGPIMRGEIKMRGAAASAGMEYDMLLLGHWHQGLKLPRAIVSNTLKGYDEYGRLSLRAPPTPPSQPMWFQDPHHGMTSFWAVKAEAPQNPKSATWVSVFDPGAAA